MKRLVFSLIVVSLTQLLLYAGNLSNAEIKQWNNIGIRTNDIKKWHTKANVTSVNEAKKWRKLVYSPYDVKDWKDAGIKTPEEVKLWKKYHLTYLDGRIYIPLGISNPKEIKLWNELHLNRYYIAKAKKLGLTPNSLKDLIKKINIEHIIKLKEWNIKPNKLIISMSHTNRIFGQELYFKNKNTFLKAYEMIKPHCNTIIAKWFTKIDMSENQNKCYMFVGTMIQRLDEKSFFGKVTKSGLVSGTGKRYFYAESFKNSWMENKTKIGVIKGDGSFSYDSKSGKQIVPKGTVIFSK